MMSASRLSRGAFALALTALALAALEGCRDPTEVVLVVDTDVDPGRFAMISVEQGQGTFATASPQPLPMTLGFTRSGPRTEFDVTVRLNTSLQLFEQNQPPIVTRRATHIRFTDGEMKMLFLPLLQTCACTGTNCPDTPDCADLIAPPLTEFNEDAIPRLPR